MTFAESIQLKLSVMHYVFMDARCTEFCTDRLKNVEKMGVGLVLLFFNSLPEEGTQVPKHVAVIL
jgi:hypothetical protein